MMYKYSRLETYAHYRRPVNQAQPHHANSRHAPPGYPNFAPHSAWGNQASQRQLHNRAIQAKLEINEPGDKYELEAARVANEVMRMPKAGPRAASKCRTATCPRIGEKSIHPSPFSNQSTFVVKRRIEEELLQTSEVSGHTSELTPHVAFGVASVQGGGQPLPAAERAFFEPRFGADLRKVRLHTNQTAADAAQAVNARAFAYGNDVYFGAGQYAPATLEGKRLLAHELTHTLQQRVGNRRVQRALHICERGDDCPDRVRGEEIGLHAEHIDSPESGFLVWGFPINSAETAGIETLPGWSPFWGNLAIGSTIWQVRGFSDCQGEDELNTALRAERAAAVHAALPTDAQRKVLSFAGAPLEQCIASNATKDGRTLNRSAFFQPLKETEVHVIIDRIFCETPGENYPYDDRAFKLVETMAGTILQISAEHGVPPVAVAGAIAEEYSSSQGFKAYVDAFQNFWLPKVPNWMIEVQEVPDQIELTRYLIRMHIDNTDESDPSRQTAKKFEELLSKADPRKHDLGPGNIKLETGMKLQEEYPDIFDEKNYAEMVDYILDIETGHIQLATLMIQKAGDELDIYMPDYSEAEREAVYVTYYNQGEEYAERFKKARENDPDHQIMPGEGCGVYFQRDRFLEALGISR